jgi:hypothetical protein
MSKRVIMGVQVTDRLKEVPAVQKILSDHGCNIKTRLGLHELDAKACSPQGLLILELAGKPAELTAMETKLKKIKGIVVKKMVF